MNISTLKPMTKPVISVAMLTGTSLIFLLLINPVNFILSLVHEFILTPILGYTITLGKYLNLESAKAVESIAHTSQLLYHLHDKPSIFSGYFWHWISFGITFAIQVIILYYLIKSFTYFHAKIAGTKSKNFKCLISTCLTLYSFFWGYILFVKMFARNMTDLSWVVQFDHPSFLPSLWAWDRIRPLEHIFLNIDFQFIIASVIALAVFVYKQIK